MKSADVLFPLRVRGVWPYALADDALAEAQLARREISDPRLPKDLENLRLVYAIQGGINVSAILEGMKAINSIIAALEAIAGYPCDRGQSTLRYQPPDITRAHLEWHQDIAGMNESTGDAVIAWVPLEPIDGTRPTIEFGTEQPLLQLDHHRDARNFLVTDFLPEQTTVVEGLNPGDVIFFSPLTLHRTHFGPIATKSRYSMDLRFVEREV